VTNSFKSYIRTEHGIKYEKIVVFKNGILKKRSRKSDCFFLKIGIENKIVISYLRIHGFAHGLRFVLESISKTSNSGLHFLFIRVGAEK
jgi:hypothetical protein